MYIIELKKSITEKTLELNRLIRERSNTATFSYTKEEKDANEIIKPERSFLEFTLMINAIADELLMLKNKLRKANETICGNGRSIIENIIYLKQSTAELHDVDQYLNRETITRRSSSYGNSTIEYTELNYTKEWIKQYYEDLKKIVSDLQNNIDRANLTTEID